MLIRQSRRTLCDKATQRRLLLRQPSSYSSACLPFYPTPRSRRFLRPRLSIRGESSRGHRSISAASGFRRLIPIATYARNPDRSKTYDLKAVARV